MAASATLALKAGVWFRRGRRCMVSPDSRATACPPSGRNSTYRPVQISGASSVFDGALALVSGARMTDHNLPFAQTSRWIRQHEERDYPGTGSPFTYQSIHDTLTGNRDGILQKCSATSTCPKIFHIDSDYESWHGHIS